MNLKDSINKLLSTHTTHDEIDDIDVDFIAYLEDAFRLPSEPQIDVDELALMCSAYVPAFQDVPKSQFVSWYNSLQQNYASSDVVPTEVPVSSSDSEKPLQVTGSNDPHMCAVGSPDDPNLETLITMFPQLCRTELKQHLSLANGDLVRAINSALPKAEQQTEQVSLTTDQLASSSKKETGKLSEDERMYLFERYGFVKDNPNVNSPLILPTSDQKESKIRYLDGKVVDTKGKKYIEIKPEYPNMPPATFLKALKRYKKH